MRLPNPWMILGAIVAIGMIFGYGHHKGWNARDAEMQAEIAKKNAESRATEVKLNEQINETHQNSRRPIMQSLKNKLLLIALLGLAGCAFRSPPPVVYQPPQVPPLPPEIGTKRQANLSDRLLQLLQPSSQKQTSTSTNSTPASTATTK